MLASICGPAPPWWPSAREPSPTPGYQSGSLKILDQILAELILALDVPRGDDALRLLDRLPQLRWVKVGPILMTREGPDFIRQLVARGLTVFLDLKWHDIPNTVAGAVMAARELGVAMATVHTLGGTPMLEAAAVAAGHELALIGVTVLTSHDPVGYARAVGRSKVDVPREVERQALAAAEAGLRGIVCSPHEVSLLRRRLGPDLYIVVPGIRRRSDLNSDQARVATAKDAVGNGATHLVVGRPVIQSADPVAAFEEFMKEAQCAGS
jgi:orotidine-5'-phosphate decarboxylase